MRRQDEEILRGAGEDEGRKEVPEGGKTSENGDRGYARPRTAIVRPAPEGYVSRRKWNTMPPFSAIADL